MKRRAAALWFVLFAVYASTIGMNAFGSSQYAGDEPHYLLTAKSIVDDGQIDVTAEYRDRAYRSFYPGTLLPHGVLTKGRLNEPHGVGFPLLIAPAYAIGGAKGVELFLAALAALAVLLAYRLALRVVPDPWALGRRWPWASPLPCSRTRRPSTRSCPRRRRYAVRRCLLCACKTERRGSAHTRASG